VLQAQLDRYPDLKNDVDYLSEFSSKTKNADYAGRIAFDETGNEVFNFGKHTGISVLTVLQREPSYYSWIMNGASAPDTKRVLTQIKLREFGK
jgi:DNA polymerase-3 subunit epsilon